MKATSNNSFKRIALLLAVAAAVAACESPPAKPPAAAPAPAPVIAPPAPAPEPEPAVLTPAPVVPATPAAQKQAQQLALGAADFLETGNEEGAQKEIRRALGLDAQNVLAASLARQIGTDPLATYGRDHFAYTVKPGETLSLIAERFLKDKYLFYALARYNDIKVPRLVASGQVLRVPGKTPSPDSRVSNIAPKGTAPEPSPRKPLPGAPSTPTPVPGPSVTPTVSRDVGTPAPPPAVPGPAPTPPPSPGEQAIRNATAAEKSGNFTLALAEYQTAAKSGQPGAAAKSDQMRVQLVGQHSASAKSFFVRHELVNARGQWQRVLELDPDNAEARREIDRVRDMEKKLKEMK